MEILIILWLSGLTGAVVMISSRLRELIKYIKERNFVSYEKKSGAGHR